MTEQLQDPDQPRIIALADTQGFDREGFSGQVYETDQNGKLKSGLITVHGEHPTKRMTGDTTRRYFVIEGEGFFTLNGETFPVEPNQWVVIPPSAEYSYRGEMTLLETNESSSGNITDEKVE